MSPQLNLLWLYHTLSHTWLGLLLANPCPDSQELKLGNTFNTVWIPGLWSCWRNFTLWMEAKWRCKASDRKGWQSLGRFYTGVTYYSLILTVTWHLKEPLEMKASPWGTHTWLMLLIISSKIVKKEKIRFEKVKWSVTGQDIKMRSQAKGSQSKETQASCFLALLFDPILHHLSHCQSQGTQKIHIKPLYILNYQLRVKSRFLYCTNWVFPTGWF